MANWNVLEHSDIRQLADNLWVAEGTLSNMPMPRRMTVIRRGDGGLVLHSPIALDDRRMSEVDALGPVRMLVVPNAMHRLDSPGYKERYPEAEVVCPRGSRKKVAEVIAFDRTYDEIEAEPALRFEHFAGVRNVEGPLVVTSGDGASVVVNDAVFNLPKMSGLFGFIYGRLMDNAGGPRVTTLSRFFMVKDKGAFAGHLRLLAQIPDLRRVIMSHGDVIDEDASGALLRLADSVD